MTGFFGRVERLLLTLLLRWGDTPWSPDFALNRGLIHNGALELSGFWTVSDPIAPFTLNRPSGGRSGLHGVSPHRR